MKRKSLLTRIVGTLALPVAMYLIMMALCYANGKMYYGTWDMWRTLIVDIALSLTCAMGIGLQFKCGRFDFSGGAIMLLTSIVAGNVALEMDNSIGIMVLLCRAYWLPCSTCMAACLSSSPPSALPCSMSLSPALFTRAAA